MKNGDRVETCPDVKIYQRKGTVIDLMNGVVLVEWDEAVEEGNRLREIPRAWVQVVPVVDQLGEIA